LINKLYNLKKNQTDQILIQKSQIDSRIDQIDAEILLTKNSIASATVQKNGAIADFMILTMHKDTMKLHIAKLESEKAKLNEELKKIVEEIIELQKQSEQFKYILEEQKIEAKAAQLKLEQETTEEFIQSKYIRK
jgi:chromosome segregation ATPase